MFLRAFAFFLVLALAWVGFATQEEPALHASASSAPVGALSSGTPAPGATDGWPDDHPMDGQSVQVQAESVADQPGLFQIGPAAHAPALATTRHLPYASAALTPPYLDGPQRPPCRATSLVA